MSAHNLPYEMEAAQFATAWRAFNIPGVGYCLGGGTTVGNGVEGWAPGAYFVHTDGTAATRAYCNNGTVTTAAWALLAVSGGSGSFAINGALSLGSSVLSTSQNGTKNGSTITAVEYGAHFLHKTELTCLATPVTISDDAGVAQYGGCGKIYDFPEGFLHILGTSITGTVTLGTTGTIINTWAGGIALGSATATTGATLTGTEADIMAEVDVAAATLKVASVPAAGGNKPCVPGAGLDGHTTAVDCYLNLVVDDDASHTAGTGTFTGVVTMLWAILGDYT